MNDLTRKRLDDLSDGLAELSPERLQTLTRKGERLNIRVTAHEKADMQATAAALGLSLSEYLSGLHMLAAPRLAIASKKPRP